MYIGSPDVLLLVIKNKYGCSVIETLMEAADSPTRSLLMVQLRGRHKELMEDQYGHFVSMSLD
jgi:hypothetical protein